MKFPIHAALAAFLASAVVGCDDKAVDPIAGGTSDDTHSGISLTGRVFDGQSRPMGAVIARLRHRGLADTTDGDGRYTLRGDLSTVAGRSLAIRDTLDLSRNGVVVHSLAVSAWVDTLPDVFLVQRDISGEILPGNVAVGSVVAIVWNTRGDTVRIPVEWNQVSRRYSGFAWSRFTGGLDTFGLVVQALDEEGRVLGLGTPLRFTSAAGDIAVPAFAMGNASVAVRLEGPASVSRGRYASIGVDVSDPLGLPKEVSWKIGEGEWARGGPDSVHQVPAGQRSSTILVQVRVDRADGVSGMDSLVIQVPGLEPVAQVALDGAGTHPHGTFRIHLADSLVGGMRIVDRWIGSPWNVQVSGADTTLSAPGTFDSFPVVYTVHDDYGRGGSDTLFVHPLPSFLPGVAAVAGSTWIDFSWSRIDFASWPEKKRSVAVHMTDGTIGIQGFNFGFLRINDRIGEVDRDSLRYAVHRQTASRRVRVKLGLVEAPDRWASPQQVADSSFDLDLPPLAWDFEGNMEPGTDGARFNENPIRCGEPGQSQMNLCTIPPTIRHDGGFGSRAVELHYRRADSSLENDHLGDTAQVFAMVSGWKDVRSLSMKLRGSPRTAWLWIETQYGWVEPAQLGSVSPNPFGVLRAKGITLGWPVTIDSVGRIHEFSMDALRWSDGVERPTPGVQEMLDAAIGFKMQIEGDAGVLFLDDIRFENR